MLEKLKPLNRTNFDLKHKISHPRGQGSYTLHYNDKGGKEVEMSTKSSKVGDGGASWRPIFEFEENDLKKFMENGGKLMFNGKSYFTPVIIQTTSSYQEGLTKDYSLSFSEIEDSKLLHHKEKRQWVLVNFGTIHYDNDTIKFECDGRESLPISRGQEPELVSQPLSQSADQYTVGLEEASKEASKPTNEIYFSIGHLDRGLPLLKKIKMGKDGWMYSGKIAQPVDHRTDNYFATFKLTKENELQRVNYYEITGNAAYDRHHTHNQQSISYDSSSETSYAHNFF
jgi:hypothetical protein